MCWSSSACSSWLFPFLRGPSTPKVSSCKVVQPWPWHRKKHSCTVNSKRGSATPGLLQTPRRHRQDHFTLEVRRRASQAIIMHAATSARRAGRLFECLICRHIMAICSEAAMLSATCKVGGARFCHLLCHGGPSLCAAVLPAAEHKLSNKIIDTMVIQFCRCT